MANKHRFGFCHNVAANFLQGIMTRHLWLAAVLMLGVSARPLLAHHSFVMEFDDKQPVVLTGVVTRVEWANPHVRFYIDVKNPDATITSWELSMPSTLQLLRRGWTRDLLMVGATTTVDAFRARDGSPLANVWQVTLNNGRKVLTGAPVEQAPSR
jgi:hypothetical protein